MEYSRLAQSGDWNQDFNGTLRDYWKCEATLAIRGPDMNEMNLATKNLFYLLDHGFKDSRAWGRASRTLPGTKSDPQVPPENGMYVRLTWTDSE